MKEKIDTVIFDLDGTLLNTLEDLTDSVNYMLELKGYPKRSLDEVRGFVGNGVRKLVERAVGNGCVDIENCLETFTKHYDKNKNNKTKPYDGIIDLLKELRTKGYKTAVVSNKYDSAVKELIDDVFMRLIDVGIGTRTGIKDKPAPDGVFEAIKILKANTDKCIYVGDSDVDFMTAQNSGLTFVGVSYGFKGREMLASYGAKYIIDEPNELLGILSELDKTV